MKRLLLIVSSIFALVACSNEGASQSANKAISFSNVSTRADVATMETLQDNGFGVWAGMKNGDGYTQILDNELVTYNAGNWDYTNTRYWVDDYIFSFVACYPRNDEDNQYFSLDANNDNSVKLSVSETPSEVDFLMATNKTDTNVENYATTVNLQFRHMLTQVSLNIWRDHGKHQNDQMRIKKVTLSNIYKGGTYTTAADAWSLSNGKLNCEYVNDSELTDDDNIGAAIVKDDGTLDTQSNKPATPFDKMMLIPQNSSNILLKIAYQLKRQNAAEWEDAELETFLNVNWELGKRYTYNVVLSSVTDITIYYIQTKVDPWGTPQVGGTVIIK